MDLMFSCLSVFPVALPKYCDVLTPVSNFMLSVYLLFPRILNLQNTCKYMQGSK